MPRAADWQSRLNQWARATASARFDWCALNCGFLVADSAVAMGLPDPAEPFRDWPARRLKRLSHARLLAAVPFPEIPVARAGRGDWLAFETPAGPALAVCLGKTARAFVNDVLTDLPSLAAATAFRVN
jgi:hypothetical protein